MAQLPQIRSVLCLTNILLAFLLASLQLHIVAGAPADALITTLPHQPPVSFKQYAGYITVDEQAGRALFYYFVEAEDDPSSKPLTLWLNGGPGCSSVGIGAFTENGPFLASAHGIVTNSFAWNKASNVIYLDSPAGVGWSYSNDPSDYLNANDKTTARDNLQFLVNWFDQFPEYRAADFFITGESYAGHYIPQLASLVVDYNHSPDRAMTFNFKGIAIGNPLLNGAIDFPETYVFFYTHGLISDETYAGIVRTCDSDNDDSEDCNTYMNNADAEAGNINPYDVLLDSCATSGMKQELRLRKLPGRKISNGREDVVDVCIDDEVTTYFNDVGLQKALHVTHGSFNGEWGECSSISYDTSGESDSMIPTLIRLHQSGLQILVYSGDQDSVIPFIGTRKQIYEMAEQMKLKTTVPYSAWFQGSQVGGWSEAFGNVTYATVRGAAHMVPFSNPARALVLFQSFVNGKPLPPHPQ